MAASRARRSRCPVSRTLDVLGDRWSLLVVRDLMRGKRRYAEFLESPEGIPTNILADRLKRLAAKGVISSRRYSQHPPRLEYELTSKGEDLRPVMRAMVEWGIRHAGIPPLWIPGSCLTFTVRTSRTESRPEHGVPRQVHSSVQLTTIRSTMERAGRRNVPVRVVRGREVIRSGHEHRAR